MPLHNITCVLNTDENVVICNGTKFEEIDVLSPEDKFFWIYLGIYIVLVIIAGLMSGLTMGLLSLDMMSITVLSTSGKPHEQKYAKKILPIVKRHHLLLVTLLLSNAAAVESMPLFLDKISSPVIAIVVSVTAVLIFGEVVPQAITTRYGLAIGATLSPLVIFLMIITFPISWPIAKLLDCVLGAESGTFFRRAELSVLVDLHKSREEENEDPLTADEALIIKGALTMRDKTVKQVCTPLESVFSLSIESIMDQATMNLLLSKGHSRVPVCDSSEDKLLGLLLIKNLIKIDPDDNLPLRQVFEVHKQPLFKIHEDVELYKALNLFQMGKSHMFVVVKKTAESDDIVGFQSLLPTDTIVGIITLEDVIEELIQEEIIDETDEYIDVHKKVKVAKARAAKMSVSMTNNEQPTSSQAPLEDEIRTDDTQPLLFN